jgi:hypothetical protein
MSDSPDTEVAFRNPDNIEDTGAQGDDDRFDDTVEDHGTYRRDRAGDVPDIGKAAHGFNRIDLDGNGTDYPTGSSYRIAIKPESYDGVEDWEEYISHFDICAELARPRQGFGFSSCIEGSSKNLLYQFVTDRETFISYTSPKIRTEVREHSTAE